MTRREVLTAAADLIESKGWCQNHFAMDEFSSPIFPTDESACRFCARGAIMAVCGDDNSPISAEAQYLVGCKLIPGLTFWNDMPGRTAAEVIAKLREVAAMPEAAQ